MFAQVKISVLIGQVVDTLAHMARPGVQIVKDVQHVPDIIGDGGRITQILFNLIGNALKFTDRGSVVIRVTPGAGHVKLVIKDTGCGIPEEKHAQIFQPFEQVNHTLSIRCHYTCLCYRESGLVDVDNFGNFFQRQIHPAQSFLNWVALVSKKAS